MKGNITLTPFSDPVFPTEFLREISTAVLFEAVVVDADQVILACITIKLTFQWSYLLYCKIVMKEDNGEKPAVA